MSYWPIRVGGVPELSVMIGLSAEVQLAFGVAVVAPAFARRYRMGIGLGNRSTNSGTAVSPAAPVSDAELSEYLPQFARFAVVLTVLKMLRGSMYAEYCL